MSKREILSTLYIEGEYKNVLSARAVYTKLLEIRRKDISIYREMVEELEKENFKNKEQLLKYFSGI